MHIVELIVFAFSTFLRKIQIVCGVWTQRHQLSECMGQFANYETYLTFNCETYLTFNCETYLTWGRGRVSGIFVLGRGCSRSRGCN